MSHSDKLEWCPHCEDWFVPPNAVKKYAGHFNRTGHPDKSEIAELLENVEPPEPPEHVKAQVEVSDILVGTESEGTKRQRFFNRAKGILSVPAPSFVSTDIKDGSPGDTWWVMTSKEWSALLIGGIMGAAIAHFPSMLALAVTMVCSAFGVERTGAGTKRIPPEIIRVIRDAIVFFVVGTAIGWCVLYALHQGIPLPEPRDIADGALLGIGL